jgi:IS30 family transposase
MRQSLKKQEPLHGLAIYVCDPRSPWQRGTNENADGLLRQYFPKGTDISRYRVKDLEVVASTVNSRPQKNLWIEF